MPVKYHYNSLEDFLASKMFTVDGVIEDGAGGQISVKGREIQATILFADISGFSRRTLALNPTETLVFANHFFSWIDAEAIRESTGIVDKYIGDEVMILFSSEFGSTDPFEEALRVGRMMSKFDPYSFCPHIGIASGRVIVGYVGTPIRYNCSVFGSAVALAARCASIRPQPENENPPSYSMTFPAAEWSDREIDKVFPPIPSESPDGRVHYESHGWTLCAPRTVKMKNLPDMQIRELTNGGRWVPQLTAEARAKEGLEVLKAANRYWPETP